MFSSNFCLLWKVPHTFGDYMKEFPCFKAKSSDETTVTPMCPLHIHIFLRWLPEISLLRIYLTWWHHISKNNSNMALWKQKQTTKTESLFSVPCCSLITWWASPHPWENLWKQLKFQHLHFCFALWQQPPRTAKMKEVAPHKYTLPLHCKNPQSNLRVSRALSLLLPNYSAAVASWEPGL